MKKLILLTTVALATFMMACGGTAENKPANAPANTATKTAAAPTAETFLDMEKKAHEAYVKADGTHFETMLSDKAVIAMGNDRMGKAAIVEVIKSAKCEGVEVKLSEPQMAKIDNDTYAFTYKSDNTGKCNDDKGKMVDQKPMRNSTVWVRSGEKWQAAWHGETEIIDPKAAPVADEKKAEMKDDEPKKDEKPAADTTAKKDEPKKDDKPAANADAKPAEPAKLTPSANTEALTKAHNSGWEAFMKKDAKYFDANLTSSFAFVDPLGGYHGSKADTIKLWTETIKCEGITKSSFGDGFAAALSPTVELLFGKGNADGTCDGQKNGDLWQTSVYIKEGDAWKLAFMFEQLPQA
jgi:hypothetical protein